MKVTKVEFEVIYEKAIVGKVSKVLSICDLGVAGIECPIPLIVSWTTTSVVDKAYLAKMKRAIRKSFDEGDRIISIKKKRA